MPETDTQSSFMIPSGVLVARYYLPKSYILPLDKRHFISVTYYFRYRRDIYCLVGFNFLFSITNSYIMVPEIRTTTTKKIVNMV